VGGKKTTFFSLFSTSEVSSRSGTYHNATASSQVMPVVLHLFSTMPLNNFKFQGHLTLLWVSCKNICILVNLLIKLSML